MPMTLVVGLVDVYIRHDRHSMFSSWFDLRNGMPVVCIFSAAAAFSRRCVSCEAGVGAGLVSDSLLNVLHKGTQAEHL